MKGKLIIIEATDGAGKKTQSDKLYNRLRKEGHNIKKIEFPNYNSKSSELVKMYLNGDFGDKPGDVNAYVASTFYAADRFASYKKEWKEFYENGGIILADRYTTANMVHQASKMDAKEEKDKFLKWLWDFEFIKFGLPVPDCVFFLNMPPEHANKLMKNRKNKINGQEEKDIHEKDKGYLIKSYETACYVANKYNWVKIDCISNNKINTIEKIHEQIYREIKNVIK
ncbi:dTMP kinase [Clostridium grantii]|uniref:Thymidylate kinase n=1 Tax=Clostridium grantii DSM 8605 TaxID=1121316 RepID=A0A1M5XRH4_9CLOT|nr:thymidylate kinase [Clostridium grantii]SHI02262.1 dTMP kinase [Clostridium grantii DSM 8605]